MSVCFFAVDMQIFMKVAEKIVTLDVQASDTIKDVKNKFQDKVGVPSYAQTLMFAGSRLNNYHSLAHYGIKKESTLYLQPDLKGLLLLV